MRRRIASILGFLGFTLSALTNVFLMLFVAGLLSIFTYPASILLRGIAWILTGLKLRSKAIVLTGLLVLSLGALLFLIATGAGRAYGLPRLKLDKHHQLKSLRIIVLTWFAYSLAEWLAYCKLSKLSKFFSFARISAVSMAILLFATLASETIFKNLASVLIFSCPFLIASAVSAAIGFLKILENRSAANYCSSSISTSLP